MPARTWWMAWSPTRTLLLGHLPEQELAPKAADAVALLALVAGQDFEPADDSDGSDGRCGSRGGWLRIG